MLRKYYTKDDFDFAIIYIQELNDFFIIPVKVFMQFRSTITLVETVGRQVIFDRMKLKQYRNRWDLLRAL
jgi:hypothetical protein